MTKQVFQMPRNLEDADAMVMTLKSAVSEILSLEAQSRFEICLSEALSNLILHADTTENLTESDVVLVMDHQSVQVDIFDPVGPSPFDLRDHAIPLDEVEVAAENGRGLGLILECADAVTYGASGARNRLQLNFNNRH